MNEKNLEYLENQLFYTGFGEIPKEELKNILSKEAPSVQLVHRKAYGNDEAVASLNFDRSDKGYYFFNSFDLALKGKNDEDLVKQNYRINYGNTFTLKEAFNLLQGRSVNKDFIKKDLDENGQKESYNAWAYLDFKDTDKNGNYLLKRVFNYDLEKKLSEHPIKEMISPQGKTELLDSLKKGNRQFATLTTSGQDQKVFVETAPKFRSLNFYDEHMKPIRLSLKKSESNTVESTKSEDQTVNKAMKTKQSSADEEAPEPAKKQKRTKKARSVN
ncbi:MAG: hypothetical protein ACTHYC_14600 [Sphingobacterium sp.]